MDDTHTDVVPVDGDLLRTEPGLPPSALVALETSLRSGGGGRGARSMARRLGWLTSVLMLAVVGAAGFLGGVQVQKRQGGTTRVAASTTGGGGGAGRAAAAAGANGGTQTTVAGAAAGTGAAAGGVGAGGAGAGAGAGARRGAGAGAAGAAGGAGTGTGGAGAAGGTADTTAGGGAGGARAAFGGGGGAATAGQVKLIDGTNIYVTDSTGNVVKVTTSDASRVTHTGQGTLNDIHPGDTVVVQGQKGADGIVSATAIADTGAATTG